MGRVGPKAPIKTGKVKYYLPVPIVVIESTRHKTNVYIMCNLCLPPGGLMQHPSIHTYGKYHPVVGKPLPQRFRACPSLVCLLVFLCQDQDEFCPGGNTQDTYSSSQMN